MKENEFNSEQEEPKEEKIDRDEFIIRLMGARDYWSQKSLEAQLGMVAVTELAQRVNEAEAVDLKVDFYVDEETNRLRVDVYEKGQMGFVYNKDK